MRTLFVISMASCLTTVAPAQAPAGTSPGPPRQQQAAGLVQRQLHDTSFIQRAVALHRLRRSSALVRRHAAQQFIAVLHDSTDPSRFRALAGLEVLGSEAASAVPLLVGLLRSSDDDLRVSAIATLETIGSASRAAIPALREMTADPDEGIRLRAADALLRLGDTTTAVFTYKASLASEGTNPRLRAARALAQLSDATAVPVLRTFLADSVFRRRTLAAAALGILGPKASAAMPELVVMLGDTVLRRIPQGVAWQEESVAPYAAWALAQILPFRASGSNVVADPLRARVEGPAHSLRDDGLGVYAWGVDSVAVFRASGFFLILGSIGEARGPLGPPSNALRRSLSFDLSQPLSATGATSRGVVRDNEAYIWIWYRRDPSTDRIETFRGLAVSDSVHEVERIEMHFRINGILHELQMGPFVEGQGGADVWFTGVHGNGTTLGQMIHPAPGVWVVRARPGSIARLWSFEDRAHPIDRGLYSFSLQIRFLAFPGGANGACVLVPDSCM